MNNLKKRIGIIGGGQLGKMMILDAKRLGFYVTILDPTPNCPAHSISDEHIIASFDDEAAIKKLASKSDVITYEFEHICVDSLKSIEQDGHSVYPTVSSLEIIQNKYNQKIALQNNNIPVPDFCDANYIGDIVGVAEKFSYPMMLKTCTGGYDGKGNALIKNEQDIEAAFNKLGAGKVKLMAEKYVPFIMEVSVLACRGIDGEIVVYPVAENIHINSILDETIVPANIDDKTAKEAMKLANQVMEVFEGVGMFCIEMFICEDQSICINEVAPRPHNSGHYTIEGCYTSQFEQHIRAITGLPFGAVDLRSPIIMKNIIGSANISGSATYEGIEEALSNPKTRIHIYGKQEVKPFRKMGHITVCNEDINKAMEIVRVAHSAIIITAQ